MPGEYICIAKIFVVVTEGVWIMSMTKDDFVLYVPRNQFYFKATGERWVRKGVEAAIGKRAVEEVSEAYTEYELKVLLQNK
jgi:hypothetical protein